MNKTYHKFLIFFSILVVVGGAYLYFSSSLVSEASANSPLTSSLQENILSPSKDKIASDISFISTLASLSNINIDTALFTSKAFQSLNNNSVKLEAGNPGRVNPFSPVNNNDLTGSLVTIPSPIITDSPLEIKSVSAVLSGTVSSTVGVTNSYFEYGLTKALGTKTISASISLIGVFITNVVGLKPETNYFYKACALINGEILCGDIIPFTTVK